jgi:hypothetical protein
VTVEVPGRTFRGRAVPLTGAGHDEHWARIQERYPFFTERQQRAGDRHIPIVALTQAG